VNMSGHLSNLGTPQYPIPIIFRMEDAWREATATREADEYLRCLYLDGKRRQEEEALSARVSVALWESDDLRAVKATLARLEAMQGTGGRRVTLGDIEGVFSTSVSAAGVAGVAVSGVDLSGFPSSVAGTQPVQVGNRPSVVLGFGAPSDPGYVVGFSGSGGRDPGLGTLVVRERADPEYVRVDSGGVLRFSVPEDRVAAAVFSRPAKCFVGRVWKPVGQDYEKHRAVVAKGPFEGACDLTRLFPKGGFIGVVLLSGDHTEGSYCGVAEELAAAGLLLGAVENGGMDDDWGLFRYNVNRARTDRSVPEWLSFLTSYGEEGKRQKKASSLSPGDGVSGSAVSLVPSDGTLMVCDRVEDVEKLRRMYEGWPVVFGTFDDFSSDSCAGKVWYHRFGHGMIVGSHIDCRVCEV